MKKELDYIYAVQKEVVALRGLIELLDWDEKVNMPAKGIEGRAEQTKIISDTVYTRMTSDQLWKALEMLRKKKLSRKDSVVVKELHKQVRKIRRLPRKFVQELTHHSVMSSGIWQKARKKDDFSVFKPALKKMIELKRKEARYLDPKAKCPYDALLDDYEEGMTTEKLTEFFDGLRKGLVPLLNKIKSTPRYKKQKKLKVRMGQAEQERMLRDMLGRIGLPPDRMRLDTSAHPFTISAGPDDVRITTRYPDFKGSFWAGVHEAGHALFELNLPKSFRDTVIYFAPSFGMHESQSLFWEKQIISSPWFWKGYFPTIRKHVRMGLLDFYRAANQVRPSFIRVEADEVTYCLHIILRFEIERDLVNGKLSVDKAEKEWNRKFSEMFGIAVKKDNDGILQDMHWSMGAIGYFPSYAIGMVYASQLMKQMSKDMREVERKIEKLDLAPIAAWLKKNVHSKGKTMLADDLVKKVCGSGLDHKVFVSYLTKKYSKIYGF